MDASTVRFGTERPLVRIQSPRQGLSWAPIPSAPGYEASTAGDIRRIGRRCLATRTQNRGYRLVTFSVDGKKRDATVHRLVADAFLGPCPEGWTVDHIDGDKGNNCPQNLRYVTGGDNTRLHHGLSPLAAMVDLFGAAFDRAVRA